MDVVGQKLLDVAKSELGYSEKSGGYTKYGDWFAKNIDEDHNPYFKTAPWCDMFIAWAADKAGVVDQVGQFAAAREHAKWFRKQDAVGTKPEPGALVFYNWAGSKDFDTIQHVGIVEKVLGDGQFVAIEGNTSDELAKRTRSTDQVVTFAYPAKIKVAEKTYQPKHAAPAPTVSELTQPAPAATATAQGTQEAAAPVPAHDLPIKEAALTGMVGVAVLAVLALGVAKAAAVRTSAAVAAAPEVRVRKKGRHHRTSGAPAVELPAGMTHYDLDDAEAGTLMMPAISAAVAQEVEDREFWGRIAHLEEDAELAFWNDMHSAVAQSVENNAQLTGRH